MQNTASVTGEMSPLSKKKKKLNKHRESEMLRGVSFNFIYTLNVTLIVFIATLRLNTKS